MESDDGLKAKEVKERQAAKEQLRVQLEKKQQEVQVSPPRASVCCSAGTSPEAIAVGRGEFKLPYRL